MGNARSNETDSYLRNTLQLIKSGDQPSSKY
jgi:hypothetical protein